MYKINLRPNLLLITQLCIFFFFFFFNHAKIFAQV
jgi:hypothetical protein